MSNYDSNDITPAHLAENDFVRVTYNSVHSDKPQSFEGTVINVRGGFGKVTIDPEEDMDNGEPRIYVLGSHVEIDDGYTDRRISDMMNPNIHIEILGTDGEEMDEAESANALINASEGDIITLSYDHVQGKFGRQRRTIEVIEEPYRHDYEHETYESCELFARVLDRESAPYVLIYAYNDGEGDVATGFEGHSDDVDNIERDTIRIGGDIRVEHIKPAADTAAESDSESEPEPEIRADGGHDFAELLEASADGDHSEALSRDEVANLEDETPVTLAYRTTQDTDKCINATVNKAWQGAYYAVVFLTTEDDKERTLHAYKSGRGTLYMDHDAPGGRRLSKLSHAYIVRPEQEPVTDGGREYPEPRSYKDLVESEETPKPLAEGEYVESDRGVSFDRLEGSHSEEFAISTGGIHTIIVDREELALFAELAGFEVEER